MVNDLASRLPVQVDLTSERFFTLSDETNRMLGEMQTPVQVELYFSASRKGLPIGLKVFAQRVEQLLLQYERHSAGKVQVKVIDPVPGSREEEEARRLGLTSRPLGPDERLYFGLAVFHGGNRRTIPLIDYRRERLLEYDFSRLIYAVQTHRLPKLAIATSLEIFGKRGMPIDQQKVEDGTAEWQFMKELRLAYNPEEVHPSNDTLPGDADALLVINPTGFDPRLLHAIDQFILSGKPAVILLDPYNYFEVERDITDGNVLGEQYFKSGDLPAFLANWGVQFSREQVVGDLLHPTQVPVQENQPPASLPVWISLSQFEDSQPATAGFDLVTLAHAGSLAPANNPAVTFTPLLQTSPKSALLPADRLEKMNPFRIADYIQPTGEIYTLAAMIEGKLRTAFPQGKPAPPPDAGTTGEVDPWILGLKESTTTSRVILIADADFIKDQMAYSLLSRTGNSALSRPRNNNISLLMNCLEQVRGSADRLQVRPKAHAVRPFTRIQQLRFDAEESFRQEMQGISARLEQLDEELTELNRQAIQGGGALVSEKALTAIRRVQKEQNALRGRRVQIQQELQRTIAALHQKLTLMNLGIMPGLVAVGGVFLWLYRTRRRTEG
jgi:ABC-type uncharacterized transport system involved in gliding motility auxiliary subunit